MRYPVSWWVVWSYNQTVSPQSDLTPSLSRPKTRPSVRREDLTGADAAIALQRERSNANLDANIGPLPNTVNPGLPLPASPTVSYQGALHDCFRLRSYGM